MIILLKYFPHKYLLAMKPHIISSLVFQYMKDTDMLMQVSSRATNMIDRLDQLIYSERLRELELFSFTVRRPTVLHHPSGTIEKMKPETTYTCRAKEKKIKIKKKNSRNSH